MYGQMASAFTLFYYLSKVMYLLKKKRKKTHLLQNILNWKVANTEYFFLYSQKYSVLGGWTQYTLKSESWEKFEMWQRETA